MVCGEDKKAVDHIADSIIFSGENTTANNTNNANTNPIQHSNNTKTDNNTPVAFTEDGQPLYTQKEVDAYINGKHQGYTDMQWAWEDQAPVETPAEESQSQFQSPIETVEG